VSVAALDQPVGDHEEKPHPYPNSTAPVRAPGWQKRRRTVSVVVEDIPSKSLKRPAETRALLSGFLSYFETGSKFSRLDVAPEGGR